MTCPPSPPMAPLLNLLSIFSKLMQHLFMIVIMLIVDNGNSEDQQHKIANVDQNVALVLVY